MILVAEGRLPGSYQNNQMCIKKPCFRMHPTINFSALTWKNVIKTALRIGLRRKNFQRSKVKGFAKVFQILWHQRLWNQILWPQISWHLVKFFRVRNKRIHKGFWNQSFVTQKRLQTSTNIKRKQIDPWTYIIIYLYKYISHMGIKISNTLYDMISLCSDEVWL